jgi:hypothetical protein
MRIHGSWSMGTSSAGGGGDGIMRIHGSRYTIAGECNNDRAGAGRPEDSLLAERVSTETQGATRSATQGVIRDAIRQWYCSICHKRSLGSLKSLG